MILTANLPELRRRALVAKSALDVGGWFRPFNLATHVIDIAPFETRRRFDALDPEDAERFSAATWCRHDICAAPWPYEDKQFDFSFCSHTLEDVRDPLAVCRELMRVSRAGYIEMPSIARELFVKTRLPRLRALFGRPPEVGFFHHRWFCEIEDGRVRFLPKTGLPYLSTEYWIACGLFGRKLGEAESGAALFWQDRFIVEEAGEVMPEDLRALKRRAMGILGK